jgi:hypothetical protein
VKSFRLLLIFIACPALAEVLPPAHELFQPLRADPRELQYALRAATPLSHRPLGEAALGDYLGLYRWDLGNGKAFQVSVGGGAFGRFDLSSKTNDLESVDYYGNLPFDFRAGRWSLRFMPYHTSSHLGDDYLKRTGIVTEKHAWDNLKWLVSYAPHSSLRLYGGYDYVFRTLPGGIGRHAVQGGFEVQSRWLDGGHLQYYWANDLQSWERVQWNPMFNSQAGCTFVAQPGSPRAVSLFMEYSTGKQPHGQFYLQQESRWTLGLKFQLS